MNDPVNNNRVVIVEDHAIMRETLRLMLERVQGLDVAATVPTAEAALELAGIGEVDLIVVDISLPGMSGIDLVRELRDIHPQVPCLVLSGHNDEYFMRRAIEAGARGYVSKDRPEEVVTAVQTLLEGRTHLDRLPASNARPRKK